MSTPLRVGVIGVGMMGADHADRLANRIAGAQLTVVSDPRAEQATAVAQQYGARAEADPLRLIAADDVDAVLIASPGVAHPEQLLACIAAGKPTLCEKPMTMDSESSIAVLRAEAAAAVPVLQIGFMRRFDPGYVELKALLDSGDLGRLLLLHNVHRNKQVPNPDFRSEMIVRDSLVHEVDVARFLFDEEITAIQVLSPAPSSLAGAGVIDPQVAIFTMAGGGMVTSEVFCNSQTGYEVRCEAVAERGSVIAGQPWNTLYRTTVDSAAGAGGPGGSVGRWGGLLPDDFTQRFARAYDIEVQAWVDAARRGERIGPSAWDGYAATAVCTAGMQSLVSGERVAVDLIAPPGA